LAQSVATLAPPKETISKAISLVPLAALLLMGCSQGESETPPQAAAQPASEASAAEHGGSAGAPGRSHGEEVGMDMRMMTPAPGDTPATRSYKASMSTMMKSMPAYTQDADVDFNQQMKVHHQAAIGMAEAQLAHGKDPASRALAQKIIADQRKEIAQIDDWLQQRR
jgi:hypothetical protein